MDFSVLVLSVVVLTAAWMSATTGFGFNVVMTPVLLYFYSPHLAVPISLVLGVVVAGTTLMDPSVRRSLDASLLARLSLGSIVGLPIGAYLFSVLEPGALQIGVGVLAVTYATVLTAKTFQRSFVNGFLAHPSVAVPAGVISGLLAVSTAISGPPVVVHVHATGGSHNRFRGTLMSYIFIVTTASILVLVARGQYSQAGMVEALRLVPAAFVGTVIGLIGFKWVLERWISGIVRVVTFAMGVMAIVAVRVLQT